MGLFDFSTSDDGSPSNGGLMSLYTNPQAAGLLGLASGLLQASGPSRIPVNFGQALGGGLQGMQAGVGNAMQARMEMAKMQAAMNPFGLGGGQQQASAQPDSQPQQPPALQSDGSGGLFGVSAGMGMPGQPNASGPELGPAQGAGPAPGAVSQPAGPLIMGHTPQDVMIAGYRAAALGNPAGVEMMKMAAQYDPTLAMQMPTDLQKNAAAAYGYGTPGYTNALQGTVDKGTITALRLGAPYVRGDQIFGTPPAAPSGYMNQPNSDGSWSVVPVAGGTDAVRSSAAASAGGKAQYNLQQVWDPTANNGAGGFVQQTVANVADAANGGGVAPTVPVGIRNNNFGNIKGSNGQFSMFSTPQDGINAADQVLSTYGNKYGINTLTGVANRWSPKGDGNNDPVAKAAAISAASGIGVNDPINLSDPAVRAKILPALFDTETPGWRNAIGGAGAAPAATAPAAKGPMAAEPPMGTDTYAQGQVKQMQDRFGTLRDQNTSAQTVISQLQNIAQLAPNAITGAEADRRAYANGLLSLVGVPGAEDAKSATDLLNKYSNQIIAKLGQGGLGTDAARSIVSAGNPNAHMTVPAIQEAVRNLSSQYQMTQAKTQLLQPFANGNDPRGYANAETTFDRNADPRVWEWQSIQDPSARQKFAAGVLKQDPKFGQKIQALEQLGAIQ